VRLDFESAEKRNEAMICATHFDGWVWVSGGEIEFLDLHIILKLSFGEEMNNFCVGV
jgi:hypothetical protein